MCMHGQHVATVRTMPEPLDNSKTDLYPPVKFMHKWTHKWLVAWETTKNIQSTWRPKLLAETLPNVGFPRMIAQSLSFSAPAKMSLLLAVPLLLCHLKRGGLKYILWLECMAKRRMKQQDAMARFITPAQREAPWQIEHFPHLSHKCHRCPYCQLYTQ
jgi:hypothetical protein